MGQQTAIEWTDHTFNPWIGCTKVHAGCTHCYAEADMDKRRGRAKWGPHGTRSKTSADYWRDPFKWNEQAKADGVRRRVFCASQADVFEAWDGPIVDHKRRTLWRCVECGTITADDAEDCPECGEGCAGLTMDDMRYDLFSTIDATPYLDWLLLTKRPENIRRMMPPYSFHACLTGDCPHERQSECDADEAKAYRENVWLGTSVSDQETADKFVPDLLKSRDLSPVLFLSAEPLIGPVDFSRWLGLLKYANDAVIRAMPHGPTIRDPRAGTTVKTYPALLDWIIAGGESGRDARPCRVDWIDAIRHQCRIAGVPCFIKQLGSRAIVCDRETGGQPIVLDLKDSKGGDWMEWPEEQRVRQFPSFNPIGA